MATEMSLMDMSPEQMDAYFNSRQQYYAGRQRERDLADIAKFREQLDQLDGPQPITRKFLLDRISDLTARTAAAPAAPAAAPAAARPTVAERVVDAPVAAPVAVVAPAPATAPMSTRPSIEGLLADASAAPVSPVAPAAKRSQSVEGLLGSLFGGNELEDLMTPQQRAAINQRGLLAAAAALLQAGGPSTRRVSLGQALGSALEAGQTGAERAQQSALTQMLTRQKLEEARRSRDLQANIARLLTGGSAPASAGGEITAGEALAASGMAAGPTVARAAMIGQPRPAAPAMSANELKASQYRQIADVYAASGKGEDAKRFMDIAENLAPTRQEVVGEPIQTATGWIQRTKAGGFIPLPRDFEPAVKIKPVGEPLTVTEQASGKQILVQRYDNDTIKPLEGFGPKRDMVLQTVDNRVMAIDKASVAAGQTFGTGRDVRPVDVGGQIRLLDFNAVPPGTTISKTLAPQVVGGAESGYYVLGGGGGAAQRPSAAGAPTAAAAPAASTTASTTAPALPAGMVPLIPGTGPKPTEDQSKSAGFTFRMSQATKTINSPFIDPRTNEPVRDASGKALTLEDIFGLPGRTQAILRAIPSAGATTGIANFFETEGRQLYRQAQENWISANLRAESGAVIGEQEMDREIKKYFPQVDDKPQTIKQKAEARRGAELAMQVRSGPAYANVQRASAAGTPPPRGRLVQDRNGVTRYVEE